jgi:hypothetical protein
MLPPDTFDWAMGVVVLWPVTSKHEANRMKFAPPPVRVIANAEGVVVGARQAPAAILLVANPLYDQASPSPSFAIRV